MTLSRPFQNAFSSGEIDPLLHARADYQRHQTGLAACRGFLPLRQGGFTRAPGTIYRGRTHNDARCRRIPFVFADNDALTLELTDGVLRVWRYGALIETAPDVPYELAIPYVEADLENLTWVQDKDVILIADGSRPIQKLSRYALDNWTIEDWNLATGPFRVQNLDEDVTIQCSVDTDPEDPFGSDADATPGTIVTLTGTGAPFAEDQLGSLMRLEPTDFSEIPQWVGNANATVGDRLLSDGKIYELTAGGNTGVTPPTHVTGSRATDASRDTTFLYVSDLIGVVRITAVTDANTATAEVVKTLPKPCLDDPTYRWSEGAWSLRYGYPACLGTYGQRIYAAGTPTDPNTVWASSAGGFSDFEPSVEADGSFAYALAEATGRIRWIKAGRNGVFFGTFGEVLLGFSLAPDQGIGPTTFDYETVSIDGGHIAPPVLAYGFPIYITRDKTRFQELRYSFETDATRPLELSLPSQHLGQLGFEQCVWQSVPQRLAFLRSSAGDLIVMTYDPDQDVLGWAVLPIAGGIVEDMDVTPGTDGTSDVLSLVVRRDIGGETRRFVEELAVTYGVLNGSQPISEAVHFFAVAEFDTTEPTDSFAVPHLEGETVHVWTDAGQYGPLVVPQSGNLNLSYPVTRASIGYFDDSHVVETLDLVAQARDGSSRGRPQRLTGPTGLDLHRTAAGRVSVIERGFGQPDFIADVQELVERPVAADLTDAHSGTTNVDLGGGYGDAVRLRFTPYGGAPMTVLGLSPGTEEGGA